MGAVVLICVVSCPHVNNGMCVAARCSLVEVIESSVGSRSIRLLFIVQTKNKVDSLVAEPVPDAMQVGKRRGQTLQATQVRHH